MPPCPNGPFGVVCIPIGISHGPDGNLWIAENGGESIAKANTSGVVLNAYAGLTGSGPFHIHPGWDGAMWFGEINSGPGQPNIGHITTSGVITEGHTPTPASGVLDVEKGGHDQMFFSENAAGKVGRANAFPPRNPTETAAPGGPGSGPGDITLGAGGFMWFTETNTDAIDVIGYNGQILPCGTAVCRFPLAAGSRPEGIKKGADGNMWFTEHDSSKLGKMAPNAPCSRSSPCGPGLGPGNMTAGPPGDNNHLYWSEEGQPGVPAAIGRVNVFTGAITEFTAGISPDAVVGALKAGSDGNIWFTEANFDQFGRMLLH